MSGTVLVVNPGSSSLKLSVLDAADATDAEVEAQSGRVDASALQRFVGSAPQVDACGVRVVHGGADFTSAVVADHAVVERIEALAPLAPLHNPAAARALRVLLESPTRFAGHRPVDVGPLSGSDHASSRGVRRRAMKAAASARRDKPSFIRMFET